MKREQRLWWNLGERWRWLGSLKDNRTQMRRKKKKTKDAQSLFYTRGKPLGTSQIKTNLYGAPLLMCSKHKWRVIPKPTVASASVICCHGGGSNRIPPKSQEFYALSWLLFRRHVMEWSIKSTRVNGQKESHITWRASLVCPICEEYECAIAYFQSLDSCHLEITSS